MKKEYRVELTEIEREELKTIIKEGVEDGKIIKRAYILLNVAETEEGKQKTDKEVSERYQVSISTVERLRKCFVKEGFEIAVKGKAYFLPKAKRKKYIVKLTQSEREELKEIIKSNKSTIQIRRSHILLGSDVSAEGKGMSDKELSEAYRVSIGTIERLRKCFVEEGLEVAVKGNAYFLGSEERKRYIVELTEEEREELRETIKNSKNAAKIRRSHILLGSDASAEGKQMSDKELSKSYNISIGTIERLRKRFVNEGFKIALNGKAVGTPRPRKIDGNVEAHLIVLSRSKAPDGYQEWNLRLLADKMVALGHIDSISHESVRQTLKKNTIKPHKRLCWVIPPEQNADFVCQMEQVLDVYKRPYDPDHPVICLDETAKQLVSETRPPILSSSGATLYDYEYKREGACDIYMVFEPLAGQRFVFVRDTHDRLVWARIVADIVENYYPDAKKITLVQDNLSAHKPYAMYELFPPERAKAILDKIEFVFTPKHGSWLNMAEIELSVLFRQCTKYRFASKELLASEIALWQNCRNSLECTVDWQFSTADARIKLKRLYPVIVPSKSTSFWE